MSQMNLELNRMDTATHLCLPRRGFSRVMRRGNVWGKFF